MKNKPPLLKYKSIFISDLHLGTKGCQANKILEFFKNSRSENLYLVGDIVDVYEISKFKQIQCSWFFTRIAVSGQWDQTFRWNPGSFFSPKNRLSMILIIQLCCVVATFGKKGIFA